jgi:hypothetical protein
MRNFTNLRRPDMLDDPISKHDAAMPLSENADTPIRRYADTSSLVAISLVMRNFYKPQEA